MDNENYGAPDAPKAELDALNPGVEPDVSQTNADSDAPQTGGGLAIAALVCGILGLVGGSIPFVHYFTLILAILGIVFGVKARKSAPQDKRGMATAGMILGIVAVALSVISIICVVVLGAALFTGMLAL